MAEPNLFLKGRIVEKFGSQAAFAIQLSVCPSVVSMAVRGRLVLTPEEKEAWAKLLGNSVSTLFGDECKRSECGKALSA